MAITKLTAICLSGVAMLSGAEARLNSPTVEPRAWIPIVDDILFSKILKSHSNVNHQDDATVDNTSSTSSTSTLAPLDPKQFYHALAQNIYLDKLLLAAERGISVPQQALTFTNPLELMKNIPFPFNLVSEGLKKAAIASGMDVNAFKDQLQALYEGKSAAMISEGILPPQIMARAVEQLDPQSFMAFLPSLDQEYLEGMRQFLPAPLAGIPSIQEVMGVFGVSQGTPAETSLRSLFPFFNVQILENYMRMASEGLPLPNFSSTFRSDKNDDSQEALTRSDESASIRMWIPFLDEILLSQALPIPQLRDEHSSYDNMALPMPFNYLMEVSKFLPISLPFSGLLGM